MWLVYSVKCGRGLAPDGGLWADHFFGLDRVHIRCCGNGGWRFRSYSGSLLEGPVWTGHMVDGCAGTWWTLFGEPISPE
ncbi:hypothetical protein C1Y26_33625, partial [Pseudomonas sp. MPR-R2A7]